MQGHAERSFPCDWTADEQEFAKAIQREVGNPEDGLTTEMKPAPKGIKMGGSSDVGDVCWKAPTMGILFAAWPKYQSPHTWGATACNGMSIGVKSSIAAAKVLAATAVDLLHNPEKLEEIKKEFHERTDGADFLSLCESKENPVGRLDAEHKHEYGCLVHSILDHFGVEDHEHHHH